MGQHKSDRYIKEKLNSREISPSANAWDRLDAMLTVAEEKKPKKDYGWLYVAAGILGFLFAGGMYLSQTEPLVDVKRNEVVLENDQPTPKTDTVTSRPVVEPAILENAPAIASHDRSKVNSMQTGSKKVSIPNSGQSTQITNHSNEQIAASFNPSITRAKDEPVLANQKTEQVTPTKVDELLAAVATEKPVVSSNAVVKVNPKSLLSQVDGEINRTFREKMYGKIKRNCIEVAEAVSIRNIQQ